MVASRQHYERAFEAYLRRGRLPHVLVDDAKRAIAPKGATFGLLDPAGRERRLKSFDLVAYGAERHALIEIKGRRVDLRRGGTGRRESWATMDDIRSLTTWQTLFGEPFDAVIVFVYWLEGPVGASSEPDLHRFEGRTYAHRAVRLADYAAEMKVRSPKWGTVDLPAGVFDRIGLPIRDLLAGYRGQLTPAAGPAAGARVEPVAAPA